MPVLLSVTGAFILLFGLIRKNTSIINTALSLLVAAALFTLPVYFSGEGTEESVKNLPGVSENIIEKHEEMALIALCLISVTGVIALFSFIFRNRAAISRRIALFSLVLTFISFGAFAQTAPLGGEIRHTELRSKSVQNENIDRPGTTGQNEKSEGD